MFRQRGLGLRFAVLPVLAAGLLYACLSGGPDTSSTAVVADSTAANAAVAAAVPSPNAISAEHSTSLKSAFDATPAAPSYSFAQNGDQRV